MQLILENVRSFCGRHQIPVRPLTLLVGENSTGKSTFLAMLAHTSHFSFTSLRPSFNEEPFNLGTYDSIATFKGGRYGRAHSFSVGVMNPAGEKGQCIVSTYASYKGQPQLSGLEVKVRGARIVLSVDPESQRARLQIRVGDTRLEAVQFGLGTRGEVELEYPATYLIRNYLFEHKLPKGVKKLSRSAEDALFQMIRYSRGTARTIVPLAPVRTRPKRTYDVISDEFSPEGDHIPVVLARIIGGEDVAQKQRVVKALSEFGAESALFHSISVKRLGKRPSDPFQILVSLAGPAANLLDVGYGVSQALPIIVQSILATPAARYQILFQQPEVHLHPRGQAALGTFFARLVARENTEFVVETHSDYLVDRVRQEVARGNIAPTKVLILFFERTGPETAVHQIEVDRRGNVLGAPEGYRRFFLEEEKNLLMRGSG